MTAYLSSKQTFEAYAISFDFAAVLGAETIVSATLTAVDQTDLSDASLTLLDSAEQTNTDTIVYGWVRAGTSGHDYLITCQITGSGGSQYELEAILPVEDVPAVAGTSFTDMIASDLDDVFLNTDEFAQTITYNGTGIKAIVHYGQRRKSSDNAISCDAWIEAVKVSDVATPAYRDTVVIGTSAYRVMIDDTTQPEGDGYSWIIDLKKSERPIPGGKR